MWKRTAIAIVTCTILTGCQLLGPARVPKPPPPSCAMAPADQAWIDQAVLAWGMAKHRIANIGEIDSFQTVFFSANCVLSSSNALTGNGEVVNWHAESHGGTIKLPEGDEIPMGVTSFTSADEEHAYFVMSTPSVWRIGGVDGGPLGLDTLMVAVMLHEGTHVAQSMTYGKRVAALEKQYSLPESFGDDSLQSHFEKNEAFSASIAQETDLFFQAASATNDEITRRLARQAQDLMRTRADRWFTGNDVYWREAEDIWLTFEGSGQWVGYQWLISERGAAAPASKVIPGFARRSRWWSQNEGLGIVLALDRLGNQSWKRQAFGEGALTILEMFDLELNE